MAEKKKPFVVVTTLHRGVFSGHLLREDEDKKIVELKDCRCAIRWNTTHGFLELAKDGPNSNSKIGSKAPKVKLYDVTSVDYCTVEAEKAWKKHS